MESATKKAKKRQSGHGATNGSTRDNLKTETTKNKVDSKETEVKPPLTTLSVHHCKFFEWNPSPISAIAVHHKNELVAVARTNNDIEIWNITHGWHLERVLGGYQAVSIKCLAWASDQLYSASLHAKIAEWDLSSLKTKTVSDSYGGAVWSIAINPAESHLAAACDDGVVRLFDISAGRIDLVRAFPKQSARLLCVSWHPDGNDLFTGGSDSMIRRWDTKTGNNSLVIKLSSIIKPRIVWSIAVLKDYTVIIGDSDGRTDFWDGNTGTMIQSFKYHEADVLAVVAHPNGKVAFSSGVDSKVTMFQIVDEDLGRWAPIHSQRLHTHDVRALALTNKMLLSGGNESRVATYSLADFSDRSLAKKISPFPHKSLVSVGKTERCRSALCQHDHKLQLWRLGRPSSAEVVGMNDGQSLEMNEGSSLLLEFNTKGDNIVCSALSSNGSYMAYSTRKVMKVFKLAYSEDNSLELKKVTLPKELQGLSANRVIFTNDSLRLIIAGSDHTLYVYNFKEVERQFVEHTQIDEDRRKTLAPILTLAVSSDNKWLASGDVNNYVHIYDLEKLKHYTTLPVFDSQHTAFEFAPNEPTLAIVCSSNAFYLYNIKERTVSNWTRTNQSKLSEEFLLRKSKYVGIRFHPKQHNLVFLYSDISFFCLNIDTVEMRQVSKFRGILHLDFLDNGELAIVERPWRHIVVQLPDPLYRARYGT